MRIGFIGMGNMGQALCKGFAGSGLSGDGLFAYAPNQEKLRANSLVYGFEPTGSIEELSKKSDMIFLCCKPYQIEEVFEDNIDHLKDKALISIAAGFNKRKFFSLFTRLAGKREHEGFSSGQMRILQVCPNTPVMVGEGVFLVEKEHTLKGDEYEFVSSLLSSLGLVKVLPGSLLDIGSAVTGCSPAFVDLFIEAYADAAVKYGIPRADTYPLIAQAVLGAAKLMLATGEHPGVLKDKVCSPGGTTIRGIQALEDCGLRGACMASVDAVMSRN